MFKNFFRLLCCLYDNVEKYSTAGQATDNKNTAQERCKNTEIHLQLNQFNPYPANVENMASS